MGKQHWRSLKKISLAVILGFSLSSTSFAQSPQASTWQQKALTDTEGKSVSIRDLQGKMLLVNFIFTACGSICPPQTASLAKLHKKLKPEHREMIRFVSISIDPEHDSPEQLREYKKRFQISDASWLFLTGSEAQAIAREFGNLPGKEKSLEHKGQLYLLDPKGNYLMSYPGTPVVDIKRLEQELPQAAATFLKLAKRS